MKLLKIAAVVAGATLALHANAATETFDGAPVFTYTGTGTLESTSVAGFTKEPTGSTGNWLSLASGESETVSFGSGYAEVSFLWGSVDSYNTVSFYSGSTLLDSYTGTSAASLVGSTANGKQTLVFTYDTTSTPITSVKFSSSGYSFELDNVTASAVPEPETYALMLAGLGAIAFVARRRKA